jgi:hypothetical protein
MRWPTGKKAGAAQADPHSPTVPQAPPQIEPHDHKGTHPHDHAHPHYISLRLRDISQLFNSMDPSPFIEKDLDDDAEEFIVSWAQEYSPDTALRLRIYVDQWPVPERNDKDGKEEDPKEMVKTAVHNHFAHRAQLTHHELTRLLKQGRTSLLIGAAFLSTCLGSSQAFLGHEQGTWAEIVRESLTIAGWVAMWRPMQIYLYDWWPVRRRERVFAKLSRMPVELLLRGHEAKPHEAKPQDAKPHEAKPDAKPQDAKSHESKTRDAKPA